MSLLKSCLDFRGPLRRLRAALFLGPALGLLFSSATLSAQGLINSSMQVTGAAGDTAQPQCGSHLLMQHADRQLPGYLERADQQLLRLVHNLLRAKQTSNAILKVPVVFHVVHQSPDENLPDSVLNNQLAALNRNFRRLNRDTGSLRPEFRPYVGDAGIEFVLADRAPDGSPSNGITRTATPIEYFGGTLPYGQNQTAQIQQWVQDSLFYNMYRLTRSALGGIDPWDTARYLNIWIGDLRVFEPLINNFEELVFLAIASPPFGHPNFAGSGWDSLVFEQGILMHYLTIGPNNPTPFPAPYGAFTNALDEGDLLSHEVGHYLGLRHIWGDGACDADDFIWDTPLANAAGQFTCNKRRNTCVDSIDGVDLPDMAENFMDYSNDACHNSFTQEQIRVMRATLRNFRPNLYTIGQEEYRLAAPISLYPNPTTGLVYVASEEAFSKGLTLRVYNAQGLLLQRQDFAPGESLSFRLDGPAGLYFVELEDGHQRRSFRILKEQASF